MALTSIFRNYTYGYIVNYVSESNKNSTTVYCTNSILFPSESLWPHWFRTICYLYGLLNSFAGVAVGSDVFMTSIAVSTKCYFFGYLQTCVQEEKEEATSLIISFLTFLFNNLHTGYNVFSISVFIFKISKLILPKHVG